MKTFPEPKQPSGKACRPSSIRFWFHIWLPFALSYFVICVFCVLDSTQSTFIAHELSFANFQMAKLTAAFFFAFGLNQLPLGMLLDRFGPHRVQTFLLLVLALGSFIFSCAEKYSMLLFAKTLMGIGASAGLMSAFMANNLNLDKKSLAIGNGFTLLMGNLGLLFSTVPAYYIISNFNWRIFNFCLSMSCISLSFILFLLIPPKPSIKTPVSDYLKKAKFILQQRIFFKMLLLMIPLGIFDSMQAFWSQFWLNKIAQIKHDEVEVYLFIMNIGVGLGMLSTGLFDRFWQRIGFKSMQMIYIFLILSLIVQWLIFSFWLHSCSHTLWFIYGFSTQFALLSYAVLCNNFAVEISGRVITLLNFFLFIIGYCYQSSMGKLIQYHISTNMIFKFFVIIQFIFLCIAMSIPHGPSKNN